MKPDSLSQLLSKLNTQQIKVIEKVLTAITRGSNPKLLQLFKLLTDSKKQYDDESICYRLYKKSHSKAYEMLKRRLYHKLLQVMVLISDPEDIERDHYHGQDLLIYLKSLSIYASLLTKYGLAHEEQDQWEEILKMAKHYALPAYELDAYLKLLPILFGKKERKRKEIQSMIQDIQHALKQYETDVLAYISYYSFYNQFKYRYAAPSILPHLKKILNNLEEQIRQTPTPRAVLTWNQLLLKYWYLQDNIEQQYQVILRLQDLLQYYPQIMSVNTKEQLYFDIALFYLAIYDLQLALRFLEEASQFSNHERLNYFLIMMHKGVVQSLLGYSEEGLENILKAKEYFNTDSLYEEYSYIVQYYLALHFFLQENYSEAVKHLYAIEKLGANKPAWGVAIRLLSILISIATNDFDLFLNHVENYRKFLSNNEIQESYPHLLYQSLLILTKTGFRSFHLEELPFIQLKKAEEAKYKTGYMPLYPYLYSLQKEIPYREALREFYLPLQKRIKKFEEKEDISIFIKNMEKGNK